MSTVSKPGRMTLEEYLAWEPLQPEKHEFFQGEVFSQAGASRNHNTVAGNLFGEIRQFLRGQPCRVFNSDMRVHIRTAGYQAYPDVSIVCPPIEADSEHVICNPIFVAEVLSPSTADFDRGTKFGYYRRIPSLREYLVLSQDQPHVEQHVKTPTGEWLLREADGIDAVIQLASIGQSIALRDLYEKVVFDA